MAHLFDNQIRLMLQRNHTQQWISFFQDEQKRRSVLMKRHRFELGDLLHRLTSRREIAAVLHRQVLEIVECNLINQDQRQRLVTRHTQEKAQLERTGQLPELETALLDQ